MQHNLDQIWDGYKPQEDPDGIQLREKEKLSFIEIGSCFNSLEESKEEMDERLTKVEKKVSGAESGLKVGWSVGKYIAVFTAEAIILTSVIIGGLYKLAKAFVK